MPKLNDTEYFKKMLSTFLTEEDPLHSMLKWMAQKFTDIEAEMKVGAKKNQHEQNRKTYFSGTRVRRFDTRLGTIYLLIPKLRKGGFVPFFITEKKRSEQALMSLIQEAFVNGVSTRKVERLAHKLGMENISASQVSNITKELDDQVESFRNRKLNSHYPFVWVDAIYEKIRVEGKVESTAILTAFGVNTDGQREILAIEPLYEESGDTWSYVFESLKKRGVKRIDLLISDAHKGIQKAVRTKLLGASWQRCKVHFVKNIIATISTRLKEKASEELFMIWNQPTKEDALDMADRFIKRYEKKYPQAVECLENGLEDSLQFYEYSSIDKRKLSSTNFAERTNNEIRRRSRVVGVFPSVDSYIRLITSYLIEYSEDWISERDYISTDKINELIDRGKIKKVV